MPADPNRDSSARSGGEGGLRRRPVERTTTALVAPSLAARRAAASEPPTDAAHAALFGAWDAFGAVALHTPGASPGRDPADAKPHGAVAAAWNLERGRFPGLAASVLAPWSPDIVLATEMDRGIARSGQIDTTARLAAALGAAAGADWSLAYGAEFVELGLGDPREEARSLGADNRCGLHGNAVLSRWPIRRAAILPLDDGALWWRPIEDAEPTLGTQRRVGGRMAVAALIDAPMGPLWAVAAHFESRSTPQSRALEALRLLEGLDAVARDAGDAPVILGGDLNTAAVLGDDPFSVIAGAEPAFAVFEHAGFVWRAANARGATTRRHPWRAAGRPERKLDWLFCRDLAPSDPWIAPALSAGGVTLSDHEAVGARFDPL